MQANDGSVGDGIAHSSGEWKFDANVAATFDDHIAKSVLLYEESRRVAVELSDWFITEGGWVYDLGCSTGTLIKDLRQRHAGKNLIYVGVDNSEPMLAKARAVIGETDTVKLINEDFGKLTIDRHTTLVYSLYSMQFVPPKNRLGVLRRIWESLAQRSALVMIEKVIDDSPVIADIYGHLHWARKIEAGFSVDEIHAKSAAIRGVMVPFTESENLKMLQDAGFSQISVFVKGCNFAGYLAIK